MFEILAGAISELARQSRAGGHFLALDLPAGLQAQLSAVDRELCDAPGLQGMLVQP